jgi:Glycosyltransferase family 87
MTSVPFPPSGELESTPASRRRALAGAAGSVVLGVLSVYVVVYLLRGDVIPVDFHVYRQAAEEIANGNSPYPWFAYPPLSALGAVPFTFLSVAAADFAVKALLVLGVLSVLAILGVRDWRCYPLALLWPSVNAAVQTGNITIPLALGAALLWRFRDRSVIAGFSLGASVAAKFLFWPLWVWLVAAGRRSAALWSIVAGIAITLATWAIVDLGALIGYPDRLRQLNEDTKGAGYTLDTFAMDLGAGQALAKALMGAVAISLLVAVVVTGRRGSEQRSFVLAVAAALACSPIVWLHYFALLLVPVAVVRPRLGPLWFVPLAMWGFGAGTGNGSTASAAVVLLVVAVTFAFAVREAPSGERSRKPASCGYAPTTTPA